MSNVTSVIDMVAKEALSIAHEKATFIGSINREFDESFTSKGAGNIGTTLRVRYPNQYTRRKGSRIMVVQDQNEATQTITMATQDGVDMRFNSQELTTDLDGFNEFSKRHIQPAVSMMMSGIDGDCIVQATKDTYNLVGTAGTIVGTVTTGFSDTTALGYARAKINQGLAPDGDRSAQIDSVTMAYISNGMKNLFNPTGQISEAFREGMVARTAMADFYENERTFIMAGGSDHTTVTSNAAATVTDGGTAIDLTGGGGVLAVGDVFTVAGVYACHPETKSAYAHLQQFTVTAMAAGGATTFTISPATYLGLAGTTAAKRNICKSDGTALALTDFNSQTITVFGADSGVYRQNLMYHKDAFTFVTADLPLMPGGQCSRVSKDGISLRVWMAGDIRNDELLMRVDILYGFKTLRPEWACRISN